MDMITADLYYLTEQDELVVIRRLALEPIDDIDRGGPSPSGMGRSTPRRHLHSTARRRAIIRSGHMREQLPIA